MTSLIVKVVCVKVNELFPWNRVNHFELLVKYPIMLLTTEDLVLKIDLDPDLVSISRMSYKLNTVARDKNPAPLAPVMLKGLDVDPVNVIFK